MKDRKAFNSDGDVNGAKMMFAKEMLCGSKEEYMTLFNDDGDFDGSTNFEAGTW